MLVRNTTKPDQFIRTLLMEVEREKLITIKLKKDNIQQIYLDMYSSSIQGLQKHLFLQTPAIDKSSIKIPRPYPLLY